MSVLQFPDLSVHNIDATAFRQHREVSLLKLARSRSGPLTEYVLATAVNGLDDITRKRFEASSLEFHMLY